MMPLQQALGRQFREIESGGSSSGGGVTRTHIQTLEDELKEVRAAFCWIKPWMWCDNIKYQTQLLERIEFHEKYHPEEYI